MKSFLSDRNFHVQVNEYRGEMNPIAKGFPQGAILSLLLFNLYVSEFVSFNLQVIVWPLRGSCDYLEVRKRYCAYSRSYSTGYKINSEILFRFWFSNFK